MRITATVQWSPKASNLWYECRLPVDHPSPDVKDAFDLFCAECGIVFAGHWTDLPPLQSNLPGV